MNNQSLTKLLMISDMITSLYFALRGEYAAAVYFLIWAFYNESKMKGENDE